MAKTVMKITNFTVVKIRYFSSLSSGSGRARHGCGSSSASCGVGVGGGVGGGGVDGKPLLEKEVLANFEVKVMLELIQEIEKIDGYWSIENPQNSFEITYIISTRRNNR